MTLIIHFIHQVVVCKLAFSNQRRDVSKRKITILFLPTCQKNHMLVLLNAWGTYKSSSAQITTMSLSLSLSQEQLFVSQKKRKKRHIEYFLSAKKKEKKTYWNLDSRN
jgi:hypothetical protein